MHFDLHFKFDLMSFSRSGEHLQKCLYVLLPRSIVHWWRPFIWLHLLLNSSTNEPNHYGLLKLTVTV